MNLDIITLFPEMYDGFLNTSIIKRGIEGDKITVNLHQLRDYSTCIHKRVDDYAYGGGAGMVLMVEPVVKAINDLKTKDSLVILTTPQGSVYKQSIATDLSKESHLIIICGHYEGYDERIRDYVDLELSIGDYVLTGGEIPSMVIIDSITRLIPGVIKEDSHLADSFSNSLLDYPTYTKPREFDGKIVPEVLLSGHHANIDQWRYERQLKKTKELRPDLLKEEHYE